MKTLAEKFAVVHAADEAVRAALSDLGNSATGEAIAPGEVAFDEATRAVYTNNGGKIARQRAIVPPSKANA